MNSKVIYRDCKTCNGQRPFRYSRLVQKGERRNGQWGSLSTHIWICTVCNSEQINENWEAIPGGVK